MRGFCLWVVPCIKKAAEGFGREFRKRGRGGRPNAIDSASNVIQARGGLASGAESFLVYHALPHSLPLWSNKSYSD